MRAQFGASRRRIGGNYFHAASVQKTYIHFYKNSYITDVHDMGALLDVESWYRSIERSRSSVVNGRKTSAQIT